MRFALTGLALIALLWPGLARAEVTVFAAASLKGALDRVAESWSAQGHDQVVMTYGSSPAMAQQILQGAPAQIYVSASEEWMDYVQAAGAILDESRVDLLSNRLVVVAQAGQPLVALTDLAAGLRDGKLAMALVDAVPAGIYGKAALQSLGLWDALAPHVVQAENVRAALALVATGEADFGLVYASDAQSEPLVATVAEVPEDATPPIRYPAALVAPATPETAAFLDYLSQAQAQAIFLSAGFIPAPR